MSADLATRRVKWTDITPLPDNPIDERRLERILSNGGFTSHKAGTPEVCVNDVGAYPDLPEDALVCADGNNRRELAIRVGKGDETVIVKIHPGLSRAEIAALFLGLNDYRQHRTNELFVRRVEARQRKAVEINEIVEAAGWAVPMSSNSNLPGHIVAVGALEWIYDGAPRAGGKKHTDRQTVALRRTLESLAAIYGRGKGVAQGNLIKGLGLFYLRYGEKVNMPRLHERVAATLPSPRHLRQASELQREAFNCTVPESIARTLRQHYNGPRRSKQDLPEW